MIKRQIVISLWRIAGAALLGCLTLSIAAVIGQNPVSTTQDSTSAAIDQNTAITFVNRNPKEDQLAKGLRYATNPANARQIISNAVQQLQHTGYGPANIPHIDVERPLAGYNISNPGNFLASGNLDAEAKFLGYYYFLKASGKLIARVEANPDATSGNLRLGTIDLDPTTATMDAINYVAALGPVRTGSYEPRLLNIIWQGSPYSLLWFKSAPGGTDLIYPMLIFSEQYSKSGLQKGMLYTLPNFLAALRTTNAHVQQARQATAEKQAAAIAENQRKAASGEDTTTTRLKTLQSALNTALAALNQLPDNDKGYFDKAIADLVVAQTDVANGLGYLNAHPGIDALVLYVQDQIDQNTNFGYPWHPIRFGLGARSATNNNMEVTALSMAEDGLDKGLAGFMGDPSKGIPSIGEIGGQRDMIMRDVAAAENALIVADQAFMIQVNHLPALSERDARIASLPAISRVDISQSGIISGHVTDLYGRLAADAVIPFLAVDSLNNRIRGPTGQEALWISALPGTISDKNGNFAIRNVPPGFYSIPVGNNQSIIEVKEGTETRLQSTLILSIKFQGGG